MRQEIETAKEVRRSVGIVCSRLERPTPESLDKAAVELNVAILSLRGMEGRLKSASPEFPVPAIANEISAIKRELSRARALLDGAGKFLGAWTRLLNAETSPAEEAVGNYTPRGTTGPVLAVAGGKVVLHG